MSAKGLSRWFDVVLAARDEISTAGEEKANFLANMSHEIRAPINVILGYSEMLERSGLSAEQLNYVRIIHNTSSLLLRMVDDTLCFSRLESGAVQLEAIEFDLRRSIEDVLCMLAPEALSKQLELTLTIDPDVPTRLIGDSTRIGQVLINLLSNAIKFTDCGSVRVSVSSAGIQNAHAEIEIRIIDTGIGIAPEACNRIFTSFQQADASISRRYGGTGLGLAIVSKLVQLWGGKVGVISQPSEGATFWFTLICAAPDKAEALNPDLDFALIGGEYSEFKGLRVLLAEDSEFNRELLTRLLRSAGIEVTEVENGNDALARSQLQAFDLIILDLHLLDMDGAEVARCLRLSKRTAPIVVFTADTFFSDRLGKEVDAYLTKPLDANKLWQTIRRLCADRRIESESIRGFETGCSKLSDLMRPRLISAVIEQRQRISTVLAAGDFKLLPHLAHELKGVAGYFGLREICEAVAEFEQALVCTDDADAIARQLARIDVYIEQMGKPQV
ncbi:MAG: response regulator [Chromatiales bacterium]|jgi:CheY-like chemotaxis protein/HPt (histidine-containing phosphotransfer) domain-containing protein|nr:response regulator [Chromatiales bacterium]